MSSKSNTSGPNEPVLKMLPYRDAQINHIAGKSVDFPADPPHNAAEVKRLHERILEVKKRWGVSYRDAAYLLYLASSDTASKNLKLQLTLNSHISQINQALELYRDDPAPPTRPTTPENPPASGSRS
ncbi:hypothetical protein ONZ45_g18062 [Pleurotus djamor]|nr:hypothetical protein ONZ45_g18062 [Pleurotus djamor]